MISRMGGAGPGSNGGILFYIGESKNFAFFQTRKFSRNDGKSMKNYYFEKNFKFTYKNLYGKLIFTHFLSLLPGLLSFHTPLEQTNILWGGLLAGVVGPGLGSTFHWGVGCGAG